MAINDYGALIYEVKNDTVKEITSSFADKTLYWDNDCEWKPHADSSESSYGKVPTYIGGHPVIITDHVVASFEKRKFPKIFTIDSDKCWKENSYLSIIKHRCKIDEFYGLNPDLIMGTYYNADTDEFIREPIEVNFNTLEKFYVDGITFDVVHYDYFDYWCINDFPNNTTYYVIIGQGLGSGFEDRYLTKYIKKYFHIDPAFELAYISYPKNPFHMHMEEFVTLNIHRDHKKARRDMLSCKLHKLCSDLFSGNFDKLSEDIHNIKLMWMYN